MSIADWRRAGTGVREIARRLGRLASTVSRELRRNANRATGGYEPYRAQQMSADRLKRPKPAKVRTVPGLLAYIRDGLNDIGAPSRSPAGSGRTSPIIRACTYARRPSTRPSTSKPKAN